MSAAARGALLTSLALVACGGGDPILACDPMNGITPICGFHNPEDMVVDPSGRWLIVSEAPLGDRAGELSLFDPSSGATRRAYPSDDPTAASASDRLGEPSCTDPPDAVEFAPHGIDLSADGTVLYVVAHGAREAVEIFRVEPSDEAPTLRWAGCVAMPPEAMMNDVAALPHADGFVVTHMLDSGIAGMVALLRGATTGEVLEWRPGESLRPVPSTAGSAPNGVAVARDGAALFVAEWGSGAVVRVDLASGERRSIDVGFSPDNLTWTSDGRLLVAGQIASPLEAASCFEVEQGTCGLASAVARIEPTTLAVERLHTQDPVVVIGGLSVALEHAGRIWLGSFGGDRIAWIAAPNTARP